MSTPDRHERLANLYDAHAPRVYAYCLRQVGVHDADDALAETFAITWRLLERVPDDALPWLVATARNVVRNDRRRAGRRRELTDRLRDVQAYAPGAGEIVADREAMLAALAALTDREREALLLIAWDGLEPRTAARVARCTERAFRARVTRARARLDVLLAPHPAQEDRYAH
ncbi:RNA polymerase sigma factor [Nocardioides mangrovicus]|uniref:RNA polymerase sigma factor n=1 Tax=Nocardioides mangrovicus TaxID=2478913 RepID=UPI0013148D8D|nr:sigma-70 family RNA polymerase sigma factor [Nocardioides mangrovicus]